MKKNRKLGLFFLLIIASLGCKKASAVDPLGSSQKCENDLEKYTTSINVFGNQPNNANCLSLKANLESVVKSCAVGLYFNADAYKEIDCSQY